MGILFHTRASLAADLRNLGLEPGGVVMAHAAVSKVGRLLNGPDALIGALLDVAGTLMVYADWDACYDELLDPEGRVPPEWRAQIPAFDLRRSRATRDNGILAEFARTWPEARRSANPGASMVALGEHADWLCADHPWNYGYGPGSPLAKLVEAGGQVIMIGAPLDTMTLLHLAEDRAHLEGKRIRRYEVPLATPRGTEWRMIEEFDTAHPVLDSLPEDCFEQIVRAFLADGLGRRGQVGEAETVLVPAAPMFHYGVNWLEERVRGT